MIPYIVNFICFSVVMFIGYWIGIIRTRDAARRKLMRNRDAYGRFVRGGK